jgi:hypothetical protein
MHRNPNCRPGSNREFQFPNIRGHVLKRSCSGTQAKLRGELIEPGDPQYESPAYNAMIDRRPGWIAAAPMLPM